ncbi:MAG: tetratricopeptide repeat protein, partial [Desulfofustis sp.]
GRVVDAPGDNLLAEFSSVVDATECAVKIQQELKTKNEGLPDNQKMNFRIGINLGDVVEEADRIYGDGVNIAARIEGLAEPGGICISRTAFDHVKNKLTIGYEYLGEHRVKNISEPVRVYRILLEPEAAGKVIGEKKPKSRKWIWAASGALAIIIVVIGVFAIWNYYFRPSFEPASVENMTFPLPEKPSIAVLPFDNLSGDPDQEYIADGITENIITILSKIPELFIIDRNSVFTYKKKPVKVQQVSEDLGVRYVLEGSVQKSGKQVRINAQLIDAIKGHHIWAERYDRNFEDLFALQDEITKKILKELQIKLTWGETAKIFVETDNLKAWEYTIKGLNLFLKGGKENYTTAKELFKQAMELDPKYAFPLIMLGWTHANEARYGVSKSTADSLTLASNLAQEALDIDKTAGGAHSLLSSIYMVQKQHEKAISEGKKAISLAPNDPLAYAVLADAERFAGKFEESIQHFEKAMRLQPYYPEWYLAHLCLSYYYVGRYEDAVAALNQYLRKNEKKGGFTLNIALAINYIRLGKEQQAEAHAQRLLEMYPAWNLEDNRKSSFFKNPAHLEKQQIDLRKAGIPEHPPLKLPDKPSIAVLPFVNMSGDSEQEYFSDGLTDQLISALSKLPQLFVIARTSTFTYKGKPVKVQQVARELGVGYVLEGSVQKAQDRLRITAQLIDAQKGHHLWSESFDRDLKDIFAIQDEITRKVVRAMAVKLSSQEQARVHRKGTKNLKAYLKSLEAAEPFFLFKKEANARAKQLLEEAIALDPEYSEAYSFLGFCHYWDAVFGWSKSPRKSIGRAYKLAQKALSIDDSLAQPHEMISKIYVWQKKYELAIAEAQKTVELNPNGAWGVYNLGWVLRCAGKPEEGILWMQKSIRLNPLYLSQFAVFDSLGRAFFLAGRYEEAIAEYNKAIKLNPDYRDAHVGLAAAYALLGREKEARTEVSEILGIEPNFSIKKYSEFMSFQVGLESEIEGLRKAGLPE